VNDPQILEQLAATDAYAPVMQMPIDAWTDHVTFAEIERRISMQTQKTEPPVAPSSGWRRSGWRIAAAAFAAVIIIGAVIGLTMTGGNEVEPATTVPPPTTTAVPSTAAAKEIAAAFVEARNNWDAAAIEALLGPGVTLGGDLALTPRDFPRVAEFERATGTTFSLVRECTQTDTATAARVSCVFDSENDWSRALGIDLPAQNVYTFWIADGKIKRIETFVTQAFLDQVLGRFGDWLEEAHPEDVDLMFVVGPRAPFPGNRPLLNPDALALWEQYSKEFVDFANAGG
jgi:hypothetical protein